MPHLVITLGDPLSVNIELLARSLDTLRRAPYRVTVIGDLWQWEDQLEAKDRAPLGSLNFINIGNAASARDAKALTPKERGLLAVAALEVAAKQKPQSGDPLAVITLPIDKHACHQAGFAFPGQTEFFCARWHSAGVMILAGSRLRVGLVTNHLPLRAVSDAITETLVSAKLALFAQALVRDFGILKPRIGVAALNPHAGDSRLFGNEDEDIIVPAVAAAVKAGILATGPLPADTVFHHAAVGRFDGVLAMYHDQGLGPLKTLHFFDAINVTGGLPHFRASPDHGPAADLFRQGKARSESLDLCLARAHHYLTTGGSADGQ